MTMIRKAELRHWWSRLTELQRVQWVQVLAKGTVTPELVKTVPEHQRGSWLDEAGMPGPELEAFLRADAEEEP